MVCVTEDNPTSEQHILSRDLIDLRQDLRQGDAAIIGQHLAAYVLTDVAVVVELNQQIRFQLVLGAVDLFVSDVVTCADEVTSHMSDGLRELAWVSNKIDAEDTSVL
jgi:hypothetical protein